MRENNIEKLEFAGGNKMAIREEKVTPKLSEYPLICHLMKTAFPRNEQFPL